MPLVRKANKTERSPVRSDEKEEQDKEQQEETVTVVETKIQKVESKKSKQEQNDVIIPQTTQNNADEKKQFKLPRFKVSLMDYEAERTVIMEPLKGKIDPNEKKGDKKEETTNNAPPAAPAPVIKFETMAILYDYPERPMYSKNSTKQGTYPAERGPLTISCPPWHSAFGLNVQGNKYYAYFLAKAMQIFPEDLSDEEKEQLAEYYENAPKIFCDKMEKMRKVLGTQMKEFHKSKKTSIEGMDNDDEDDGCIKDPWKLIKEFVRYQKRNEVVDKTLPKVFKVNLVNSRRNDLDATCITFPDGEEIPFKDWPVLVSKAMTSENDIRIHQLYYNYQNVFMQLKMRSLMLLELTDQKSGTTQQDRVQYWSSHDSDRANNLHKIFQIASQKTLTDTKQKEEINDPENNGKPVTTFQGIVNNNKKNPKTEIQGMVNDMNNGTIATYD